MALKPQDVVVAAKVALAPRQTYPELAKALGMSLSEVHGAVKRAENAGLVGPHRTANRVALLDFLLHGVRCAFAPKRGPLTRGMPTAHGAPPLNQFVERGAEPLPVWPDPDGTERGESFEPLYRSVPGAAKRDPKLYEALSLIDAIRGGRSRDRRLAEEHLRKLLLPEGDGRSLSLRRFSLDDPERRKISGLLTSLIGANTAAYYRSVLDLLAIEPPIVATSHLVGHLASEIESSIRQVITAVMALGERGKQAPDRCASCGVDKNPNHKISILSVLSWMDIPSDGPTGKAWVGLVGKENLQGLHKQRHRDNLEAPRPIDPEFWTSFEGILTAVLGAFESRYASVFDKLDKLAATKAPSKRDAETLRKNLPQTQIARAYFFNRLNDPDWIKPLDEVRYFARAPEAEGESGSFPPRWHALDYLARVVSQEPAAVAKIALAIPATENCWVNITLAQIALALPPNSAAEFASHVDGWLTAEAKHVSFGLAGHVVELAEKLAKGGFGTAALSVLDALLRPVPTSIEDEKYHRDNPQCRLSHQDLQVALDKLTPTIVGLGELALKTASELLEKAVRTLHSSSAEEWDDGAHYWRPAIEDAPANRDDRLAGRLVSLTRDIAMHVIASAPTRLEEIVTGLEAQQWDVFRRIALHLLAEFHSYRPGLAAARLLDRGAMRSPRSEHEYVRLLERCFGHLTVVQQREFLSWVNLGPLSGRGRPSDDASADVWRLGWLRVIAKSLPPDWQERREKLERAAGGRAVRLLGTLPEGIRRFASGSRSPFRTEDLQQMTPEELIAAVKDWIPVTEVDVLVPRRLSQQIAQVVAGEPNKYAVAATEFRRLGPTYISGLFDGFDSAVRAGRPFEWAPVVDLGAWVTAQAREISVRMESNVGLVTHWGDDRKAVLRLLSAGMRPGSSVPIAIESKEIVWQAIKPTLDDPDGDEESDRDRADPMSLSINRVRSIGVRGVIDYALWVARTTGATGLTPEFRGALNTKLAECSVAVRAVFGERIDDLVRLDEAWCATNIRAMFSQDDEGRDIAWETYLEHGQLDLEVFKILRWRYQLAIDELRDDVVLGHRAVQQAQGVGDHLGLLYWNGRIGWKDQDQLLELFFANGPPDVTGYVLENIGRWLHQETNLSDEVRSRLVVLWEKQVCAGRKEDADAFASWFSCGKFDEKWALHQFEKAIELGGSLGFTEKVGEGLVDLLPRHLPTVLACLDGLIRHDKNDWVAVTLRGSARTILERALAADDAASRRRGRDLINYQCARGNLELKDLLASDDRNKETSTALATGPGSDARS